MGVFRLGKADVLGKAPVSTGFKLGAGKVPQCVFGVHINDPTGNVMALHDAYRGKCFEGGDAGLTGYPYRAEVVYSASVGGSEGYQFLAKTYYAKDEEHGGSVGDVNGSEVLDGEPEPIPKFYMNELCRWDFADVRFQLKGVVGTEFYTYRPIEKVDGVYCLWLFKMAENPDSARTVCCYWGKQTAADESSDAAAEAIIPNVALALPLDEQDAEQTNAIVITDDSMLTSYTGSVGAGTLSATITEVTDEPKIGASKSRLTIGTGGVNCAYTGFNIYRATDLDLSSKSRITFYLKGLGLNDTINVNFWTDADNTKRYTYTFVDNSTVMRKISIPMSSFTAVNSPNWATVRLVQIIDWQHTGVVELDRIVADTGVPAQDYSGNGNHGTATGTQIVPHPILPNKTARKYLAFDDVVSIPANAVFQKTKFTIGFTVQPQGTWTTEYPRIINNTAGYNGWVIAFAPWDNGRQIIFARNGDGSSSGWKHQTYSRVIGATEIVRVVIVVDGTSRKIYLNQEAAVSATDTAPISPANAPLAFSTYSTQHGRMILSDVFFISDVALDATQVTVVNANYIDPRLIEGSVVVRKWASTTLPTVASVGPMQVRQSYGKQDLYPSVDNLNFTLDRANKKAALEFYLENTQRESANATVLYSGQAEYWTKLETGAAGSYTCNLVQEADRLRVDVTTGGTVATVGIYKVIAIENWAEDFLVVELDGTNSGQTLGVQLSDSSYVGNTVSIVDNFIGRKVFPIPMASYANCRANVRYFRIQCSPTAPFTFYIRRAVRDNGVWAYVEVGVPDQLISGNSALKFYSYNPSITNWDTSFITIDALATTTPSYDNHRLWLLNGLQMGQINGDDNTNYSAVFGKNKRKMSANRFGDVNAGTMIYDKAKTKYRIGFAIKMPPADMQASASSGGGQCRLKLEVYYK